MIIGGVLPVLSNDAAEIKRLRKKLKAAVKAEREVCASIADAWAKSVPHKLMQNPDKEMMKMGVATAIAFDIRARGKEGSDE